MSFIQEIFSCIISFVLNIFNLFKQHQTIQTHPNTILADRETVFSADCFLLEIFRRPTFVTLNEIESFDPSCLLSDSTVGRCNLHALHNLHIFAADVTLTHPRGPCRILFYSNNGQLWFYGFIYHHNYDIVEFIRNTIHNIPDEKRFLNSVNKAMFSQGYKFGYFKSMLVEDVYRGRYQQDVLPLLCIQELKGFF